MDIHQPEWCGVCFTSFGTPGLDIRIDVHLLDSRFGCASCELLAQVNQEHSPHLRYRTEPLLGASLAPWLDEDPTPPSIEIKSDKRGGSGFDSGMVKYILIKGHDGERRYVDIFTERGQSWFSLEQKGMWGLIIGLHEQRFTFSMADDAYREAHCGSCRLDKLYAIGQNLDFRLHFESSRMSWLPWRI